MISLHFHDQSMVRCGKSGRQEKKNNIWCFRLSKGNSKVSLTGYYGKQCEISARQRSYS